MNAAQPAELLLPTAVFGVYALSVLTGRMSINGLTPSNALLIFYMIFSVGGCMAAVLHIATSALEVQVYTPHTQMNEMMAFYRPDA